MKIKTLLLFTLLVSTSTGQAGGLVPIPPNIGASSYLLVDYHSGQYLAENNINARAEPASLTKIMTVYVVADELAKGSIGLEDKVKISEKAWRMEGSRMFIEVGKLVSVADLLRGVIVQSGNDASVALAEYVSGDEEVFAAMMNQYAAQLGMTGSNFVNSTGLPDPNHYTTAADMAKLAVALIQDFPAIYLWHAEKQFTFNGIKQNNRNGLLWRDDSVDGIKTGHTEAAGFCLVASAARSGMRLVSVIMGAANDGTRTRESQALLNYGFRFYETRRLFTPGEVIADSRVWKGAVESFNLGLAEGLVVTIPRGRHKQLQTAVVLQEQIIAPVDKGAAYGEFNVTLGEKQIANLPLVALDSVAPGSWFERMLDEVRLLFE
ncbi:MAG: D-alanyl-D-alanine carboxypeptidase family protein [Gammaproteobacteria bacterium]